ncbi:unnamed protein product, partial [Choristocarpus tenellus]
MMDLDRENRAILLPDGSVVPYDALVLCTGLQDNSSRYLGLWLPGVDPSDPGVPGFLSLDTSDLLQKVEAALGIGSREKQDRGVVVYGGALKALAAVQGLIDLGVQPQHITVVYVPPPAPGGVLAGQSPGQNDCLGGCSLGDPLIDKAAAAALSTLGVGERNDFRLTGVRLGPNGNVEAVMLEHSSVSGSSREGNAGGGKDTEESLEGQLENTDTLLCTLLLCGATPDVDPDVFQAVNRSGLVYDGKLVVDLLFRTADPTVLAGGTLTKFSRVHRRVALPHQWYNSREVGEYLATCILAEVDPLSGVGRETEKGAGPGRVDIKPPKFELPRCVSALLPGGLHYMRVTSPQTSAAGASVILGQGVEGESDVSNGGIRQGEAKTFATGAIPSLEGRKHSEGGSREEGGQAHDHYCAVRVDALDRVCDIVYCGAQPVEAENLSRIVGIHLGYLQGLENALESGAVEDLVSYFRRDCFSALYHDRFRTLVEDLRAELGGGDEMALELLSALDQGLSGGQDDEWISITIRKAVGLGGERLHQSTRKVIEAKALDWVRKNRTLLPRLPLP